MRAVTVPFVIGTVLFLAAVVGAVVLVVMQPHAPDPSAISAGPGVAGEPGLGADDMISPGEETGSADADDPQATVLVHVVGEVRSPGVVELSEGARVHEAIQAAGGATEEAVLAGVNLARRLSDGEQVVVPNAEAAASMVSGSGSASPGGTADGIVDLNLADASALETLPGVGPALAQRIIDWRSANGGFSSVDQLLEVSGIGPSTLERVRAQARV